MAVFNTFFTSVLLAVLYASFTDAAPWPVASKHGTHHARHITRDLKIDTYHPETTYKTYGAGVAHRSLAGRAVTSDTLKASTASFVTSELGVNASSVGWKSGYTAGNLQFGYVKQYHDGIPYANAVANVAFKGDKVVSFGSSFVKSSKIASSTPSVNLTSIIPTAEKALAGKYNDIEPTLEYLVQDDGSVALTHVVQVRNDTEGTWYEAFVDAHSGEILSVTDFVADASYTVLPINRQTLAEGQARLTNPQDLLASPLGWHSDGTNNFTTTSGNNVVAFKGAQTSLTTQSSAGLVFDFPYDTSLDPAVRSNVDAARTNAFFVMNTVHDIAYRYGFTEAAFNFQTNNFGKGGRGGDRVLMSVQDSSGTNNAQFGTPPDGQSGVCQMFIFTLTAVRQDGSLENDIPVHEMTHGITNRMTGGGTGRCLQTIEAGGMGEGWSDAMAFWTEQKSATVNDFVVGAFVSGNPAGLRKFPYSTSRTTNPLTFGSVKALNEVHNIGEVWANMLHQVYAALVAEHGFSATARTDPTGTEGNVVYLHLFIDALALQPCNPTFTSARDAWIQADANRFNGANECLLWTAFASRGLGLRAANFVDDFTVPARCA